MIRPRPAPIAARMAISRRLPTARANRRLATFAHAISRTKLTAPTRTSNAERTLLTRASRIGSTLKPWFARNAVGYSRRNSSAERSEEHTSELQSHHDLVCRLLLEKKKKHKILLQMNKTNVSVPTTYIH